MEVEGSIGRRGNMKKSVSSDKVSVQYKKIYNQKINAYIVKVFNIGENIFGKAGPTKKIIY